MSEPCYSYQKDQSTRRLVVELEAPASSEMTRIEVECVMDVDDFDEVAGIEVLDLSTQIGIPGGLCVEPVNTARVRVAYDETVDALYIKLGRARAQHQIVAHASLFLDTKTTLVRVEVSLAR